MEELERGKQNRKRILSEEKDNSKKTKNSTDIEELAREVKQEKLGAVCRVCLHEGDIPIFGNEYLVDVSESLALFTGIEIQPNDKFPQHLCHSCHEQLQSAILFRHTAQETDLLLRKPAQEEDNYDVQEEYLDCNSEYEDDNKGIFKETHENFETSYHCKLCVLDFNNSDDYGTHMLTKKHENVSDECPFCNRKFKCIKTHLNLHTKQKTIVCEICGQKYLYTTFVQHREIHIDELKFKCVDCPYKGRSSADLKMHRRTHTGEKPYQCSQCPSRFISKSNLNRHLLTHNNEFKFQCSICNKGYFFKRDLEIHMTWHTGVRDYVCGHCDKNFPHKKSLLRHTLKVHKREKMRSGKIPNYIKISSSKHDDSTSKNIFGMALKKEISNNNDVTCNK